MPTRTVVSKTPCNPVVGLQGRNVTTRLELPRLDGSAQPVIDHQLAELIVTKAVFVAGRGDRPTDVVVEERRLAIVPA